RIYVSIRNRRPCHGLYLVANGEIKGQMRWRERQAAYSIEIGGPLETVELINTCGHNVQLLNLFAVVLPEPQTYLDARKVRTRKLMDEGLKTPAAFSIPSENASIKSIGLVVKMEPPFDWDIPEWFFGEGKVSVRAGVKQTD